MAQQEQVFTVRIPPKNDRKKYHIMKFHSSLKVDPSTWTQARMVRENNKKEQKGFGEEMPKYGAGSEFGREEREAARRMKFGYNAKKYDPDKQPWLMRIGGKKDGRHFKGIHEGGVSDNTTFYVFTHAADGSFEAHPIKEWYNFIPRVAHKTLDADEAEEKFAARGKILNHWAVMVGKKVKPGQEEGEDVDDDGKKAKGKGKGKGKEFKISDMEEDWLGSGNELDSDSDDDESKDRKKGKGDDDEGGKKKKKGKKKSKEDVDDEAFEDSDDGEGEGREVDYMSDESSDEEEVEEAKYEVKGVDQDEGLAKMLDSDSDEEDDDAEKKKDEGEKKDDEGRDEDESAAGKKSAANSKNNSRAGSPAPADNPEEKSSRADKRKAMVDKLMDLNATPEAKRSRLDFASGSLPSAAQGGSTEMAFEEDVRRYLARKPMTTTEILKKVKSKKTNIPKDELMPLLLTVLKRINPHKQKVKGTMYLSLKTGK